MLACCGAFANLVQLEFTECQLGNVGVARLVASVLAGNALPRLQHLSLRNNGIGDAGWNTLAAAIGRGCSLGNLQTCDFSQNDISDAVLTTLKAALTTVPAMRTMFYSDADGRVCHSLTVARAIMNEQRPSRGRAPRGQCPGATLGGRGAAHFVITSTRLLSLCILYVYCHMYSMYI